MSEKKLSKSYLNKNKEKATLNTNEMLEERTNTVKDRTKLLRKETTKKTRT